MNKVLVIGDLYKETQYFVAEIPGANQFMFSSDVTSMAGSKTLNAARILAKDGVSTSFYGKIGNDSEGNFIKEKVDTYGIDTDNIRVVDSSSGLITVITNIEGKSSLILFAGANKVYGEEDLEIMKKQISTFDMVYTYTNFELNFLYKIFDICHESKVPVFLDFPNQHKGFDLKQLDKVEFVAPNRQELGLIFDGEIKTLEDAKKACIELRNYTSTNIIVTIDADGCLFLPKDQKEIKHFPTQKANVIDATGSGDIFRAIFVSEYLKDHSVDNAIKRALEIASRSVEIKGVNNTIESLKL